MEEYLYVGKVLDKDNNIIFSEARYPIKASSERSARRILLNNLSRRLKMPSRDINLHGYLYKESERNFDG